MVGVLWSGDRLLTSNDQNTSFGPNCLLRKWELKQLSVRKRAEAAAVERLGSLKGHTIFRSERPGYTKRPIDNLVPGVRRRDFWEDLQGGDGSELADSLQTQAKFCAAYSSSALAVNTFGPFRHTPGHLVLAGHSAFSQSQFERRCPTGLRGIPPNLDFVAAGDESLVAVESKFLETLQPKKALFSRSYDSVIQTQAEPAWQNMYKALVVDPTRFIHLDAAQLVKHYLGIRNTFRTLHVAQVLLYLYWEPTNAEEIPDFMLHRREVAFFSSEIEDSEIQFLALSYHRLWKDWEKAAGWEGMLAHVDSLRQRYGFGI